MYFDSFAELWHMAGHGPYVWVCYAVTFSVLIGLFVQPLRKKKQVLKAIKLRRLHQES